MNLTENEEKMLMSVYQCDFGNNGDCIWAWAHNDSRKPHNLPKTSASGVIGSLVKKGLMVSDDQGGRDDTIGLTEQGQAEAYKLLFNF